MPKTSADKTHQGTAGLEDQDAPRIRRVTWIGLLINVGLSGLKFVVGILGTSQAVVADAVHSLSDVSTDLAVLFGVKYWSAPPDAEHPYGHRRIEALITTAIGLALAGVAIGIAYHALTTVRQLHVRPPTWIALMGPLLSIVLKEWLYRWTVAVGRRARSSAVIANAWHHRSDALSSLPALAAVAFSLIDPEWAFVDHVGALVVSLFILNVSWNIVAPSLAELTDCGGTAQDRADIRRIVRAVPGVRGLHALRTRRVGAHLHVDLHIQVDPELTVRTGHGISEDVKHALLEQDPRILDVVVHLEPVE
ncbi:MAG: cation transporter [Verrucomicrobia bacterium]|nr:cation transporter [Verrucomicrobiota bacterium]